MEKQVKKGIDLLDVFIPKSLDFTKSLKQAETILHSIGVDKKQITYLKGKLSYNNKDFAGFYCNLDTKNRKIIFNAFDVFCEAGNIPNDPQEKFSLMIEIRKGEKDRWDCEPFQSLFIHQFCLMAYNSNPLSLFEDVLRDNELYLEFQKSKIANYGNYKNWARFWLYLSKYEHENAKNKLIDYLFSYK